MKFQVINTTILPNIKCARSVRHVANTALSEEYT